MSLPNLLFLLLVLDGSKPAEPPPTPARRTLTWAQKRRVAKRAERIRSRESETVERSTDLEFVSSCQDRFDLTSLRGTEEEFDDDGQPIHGDQVNFVVKKLFGGSGEPPVVVLKGGGEFKMDSGEFVEFAGWHEEGYRIKGRIDVRNLLKLSSVELRCESKGASPP
jgi:hypothetical protein